MELYGLDCVDLVVSYTILFLVIAKKCKFSENNNHQCTLPAASNRYGLTGLYAKNKKHCENKRVIIYKSTLNHMA